VCPSRDQTGSIALTLADWLTEEHRVVAGAQISIVILFRNSRPKPSSTASQPFEADAAGTRSTGGVLATFLKNVAKYTASVVTRK
jgi:hypothetical protein